MSRRRVHEEEDGYGKFHFFILIQKLKTIIIEKIFFFYYKELYHFYTNF